MRLLSVARFILSESVPYIFGLLTISNSKFKLNAAEDIDLFEQNRSARREYDATL